MLYFPLTQGNDDDRNPDVINVLTKNLFSKLYADKVYISQKLFDEGVHLVPGIRSNMKNSVLSFHDKIFLCKRSVIECINDKLKNISQIEHSRNRSTHKLIMNIIVALGIILFFPKKPSIKFEMEKLNQLNVWK